MYGAVPTDVLVPKLEAPADPVSPAAELEFNRGYDAEVDVEEDNGGAPAPLPAVG